MTGSKSQAREGLLFLMMIALIAVGLLMIYSSSTAYAVRLNKVPAHFFLRQALNAGLGLLVVLMVSLIDYRFYQRYAFWFYLLALGLCLFALTGQTVRNGAARWVTIAGVEFMPSDLMKVASVMVLAKVLTMNRQNIRSFTRGFLPIMAFIAISVVPILLQPNLSTTIVIAAALVLMYVIGGMHLGHLALTLVGGGVGVLAAIFLRDDGFRVGRLTAFLDPLADFRGTGWQLSQSLFAVSTGGVFGVGFGKSTQKVLYLSEAHNDFIYAIICEEFGLVGALLVIILYVVLLIFGLQIAVESKDFYGKHLASGLTLVLGLQAFVNIAVVLGMIPPTGLPLPFISYGGTSLWISMAMIGILLNISRQNRKKEQES